MKRTGRLLAAFVMTLFLALPFMLTAQAAAGDTYSVRVESGYLALRTAKAFDSTNEIGKLYTGELVQAVDVSDSQYWWVYAPTLGKYGYVNKDYLVSVGSNSVPARSFPMTARVDSGYLALRNAKAFDSANEIGKLYTGDTVYVMDTSEGLYWWVYAPTLNLYGYVNSDYLTGTVPSGYNSSTYGNVWTVRVESGYLALRTAKAYDYTNEIGSLYTGQTVQAIDTSDSQYWWVYAPTLGKYGYVNKDYLVNGGTISYSYVSSYPRTVRVDSGYLALRNAKAYDSSNEIGKLYTGQVVYVQDSSDSQYWWVYAPTLNMYGYVNKDYLK